MVLRPTSLCVANAVVLAHHRHNKPVKWGYKFSLAAYSDTGDEILGVVIVGRPVARRLDDGLTAEVLRLCVVPGAPKNACSFL